MVQGDVFRDNLDVEIILTTIALRVSGQWTLVQWEITLIWNLPLFSMGAKFNPSPAEPRNALPWQTVSEEAN